MATKQLILELEQRLVRAAGLMAQEDYRTMPQQIAWLIRREAIRRKLLRPTISPEDDREGERDAATAISLTAKSWAIRNLTTACYASTRWRYERQTAPTRKPMKRPQPTRLRQAMMYWRLN